MSLTTLSDNITTNGLYEYDPPAGYDGFSSATINVNVTTTPNLTPGSATITSNGTIEIDPPAGYDGFSSFTVTTNVQSTTPDYDIQSVSLYTGQSSFPNNPESTISLTQFQQRLTYDGPIYISPGQALLAFTSNTFYIYITGNTAGSQIINPSPLYYTIVPLTYVVSRSIGFTLDRQDSDVFWAYTLTAFTGQLTEAVIWIDPEDLPSSWYFTDPQQ